MVTKSNLKVEVRDTETEIIESTETSTTDDRIFAVGNREKEITATAWGLNDEGDWVEIQSTNININEYNVLILGMNHYFHVKLTGKTKNPGEKSIVDGYFTYTEP